MTKTYNTNLNLDAFINSFAAFYRDAYGTVVPVDVVSALVDNAKSLDAKLVDVLNERDALSDKGDFFAALYWYDGSFKGELFAGDATGDVNDDLHYDYGVELPDPDSDYDELAIFPRADWLATIEQVDED